MESKAIKCIPALRYHITALITIRIIDPIFRSILICKGALIAKELEGAFISSDSGIVGVCVRTAGVGIQTYVVAVGVEGYAGSNIDRDGRAYFAELRPLNIGGDRLYFVGGASKVVFVISILGRLIDMIHAGVGEYLDVMVIHMICRR